MALTDTFGRPLANLRLSVTDRCNIRCSYCMPEQEYVWLPREDILDFEEFSRLTDVFIAAGVSKVRVTGGEPLLRRGLPSLINLIAAKSGIRDLALTTNGVLLADHAEALRSAGLHRITISLDTLDRERFRALTRHDELPRVLEGVAAASRAFGQVKIDAVIIRGVNDDELATLIDYGRTVNAEVRFIEYMDVGGATQWSLSRVVARQEMLDTLAERYGAIEAVVEDLSGPTKSAPADRFRLADGTVFGIISSTTAPFCRDCDRSRLTADGVWYLCLYAARGIDLRRRLRGGASDSELKALIEETWRARTDRGAEDRLALRNREPFIPLGALKKDPHLEMHTRGG